MILDGTASHTTHTSGIIMKTPATEADLQEIAGRSEEHRRGVEMFLGKRKSG
jgi:hypothetical protein